MTSPIIPVIDISPLGEATEERQHQVIHDVATACETIGFLIISGYGIVPEIFACVFAAAFEFFDLPAHEKQRTWPNVSGRQRGYAPFASKGLAATLGHDLPLDLRESFFLGPLDNHRDYYGQIADAAVAYSENLWPGGAV